MKNTEFENPWMKIGSPEGVSVVFDVVKIWDVEVNVSLREMSKK